MSEEQKSEDDQQQFWQMAIDTWQSSGLSVRKFFKQEKLSELAFYFWRKKLTSYDESAEAKQKDMNSSAFIQVSMPKNNPVSLELVLIYGDTFRINSEIDSKTLASVLSILREADLC